MCNRKSGHDMDGFSVLSEVFSCKLFSLSIHFIVFSVISSKKVTAKFSLYPCPVKSKFRFCFVKLILQTPTIEVMKPANICETQEPVDFHS